MIFNFRRAGMAVVLGAIGFGGIAFGATAASAHPAHIAIHGLGFHGAGFHGAGFHGVGVHGVGIRFGGWATPQILYQPVYSGCYVQRYVNDLGGITRERVCY